MAIKYRVELGWSEDDKYEFNETQRETAFTFAEIATANCLVKGKEIKVYVINETDNEEIDINETNDDQSNDESEV